MADGPFDADRFWDRGTPQHGARAVAEIYGAAAAVQAALLARSARAAGHDDNYRFWTAVYARLVAAGYRPPERRGP